MEAVHATVADVDVRETMRRPVGVVGAVMSRPPPPPEIVAVAELDAALRLQAASYALTVYVYELPARTDESV